MPARLDPIAFTLGGRHFSIRPAPPTAAAGLPALARSQSQKHPAAAATSPRTQDSALSTQDSGRRPGVTPRDNGKRVRTWTAALTYPDDRRNVFQIYADTKGLLMDCNNNCALVLFDGYVEAALVPAGCLELESVKEAC